MVVAQPGRTLSKAGFLLTALPAIVRASLRLVWLERRLPLDLLVERLRTVEPFRVSRLCHPDWLLASVERLLPALPPWRYGRCLRRSLLLLDLWSRCGLRVRLHLGVRRSGEAAHEGHAWVTASDREGTVDRETARLGYPEAFEL